MQNKEQQNKEPQKQQLIDIGLNIRYLRKFYNWNQMELALKAGTRQGTVSQLENCSIDNPSLDTLQRIAEAFDITVAQLCDPRCRKGQITQIGLKLLKADPENYFQKNESGLSQEENTILEKIPDLRPEHLVQILRTIRSQYLTETSQSNDSESNQ